MTPAPIEEAIADVVEDAIDDAAKEIADELDEGGAPVVVVAEPAEQSAPAEATDAIAFTEAVRGIAREEANRVVMDWADIAIASGVSPGDVREIVAEELDELAPPEPDHPAPPPPDDSPTKPKEHWLTRKWGSGR